ncbi:MAG TPA: SpoIID/LytB domain-containing protein [Patescibacteria group bacterium]|nr:SpoIID/LytB domain-containing protein [Patescibacteria group bacterium]
MNKVILLLFAFYYLLFTAGVVRAEDEFDKITKQIDDLKKQMEMSIAATVPLEKTLKDLDSQIAGIRVQIVNLSDQLEKRKAEVAEGEKAFALKEQILEKRVRSAYKSSYHVSCLLCQFISTEDVGTVLRVFTYQKSLADEDKRMVGEIIVYLADLDAKKKKIEQESTQLASLKLRIDEQADFFRTEIAGARNYQKQLGSQIAELTVRQQALLAAKTGLFSTSVGNVPLADDPASRPDYNPGFSPAFAAFSFGAPHFKGMSQYGAFGRAKEGQNAEDILRAYYGGGIEIKKDYSTDITIQVDGYGGYNIEEYTKRIYEMPASWGDEGGMEALKAQAVAARSYALARTNNGASSICATESCQVFKPEAKGGKWDEAVNATRGWALTVNGSPFSSMYASTSGGYQESYSYNGYSTPGFWDTKRGREGWTSDAYEKIAGSPWFYKGWYKTRSGVTCGRSHPWLNKEEFADIVNAVIVYQNGGDMSGVFPEDIRSCFGGGDQPWSKSRLKEEADRHGGGLTSVNSVSVVYSNSGTTAKVIVDGREFDGSAFHKAFNLRAPGALHLKSGLFNIEKK